MRRIIRMLAVCTVAMTASGCFSVQLGEPTTSRNGTVGDTPAHCCCIPAPSTFKLVQLTFPVSPDGARFAGRNTIASNASPDFLAIPSTH